MTPRSVPSHPKNVDASVMGLLSSMDAVNAALILSSVADITLVLNSDGVIAERVFVGADMPGELFAGWVGKAWSEVATIESQPKIQQMLHEATMGLPPRWRQINHQVANGIDIPVRYSVIRAGDQGHFVAIGRDMRNLAAMQQKLLAAEQSIEQEYARLRHAETRFRLLMQVASEAIIVVDARSGRITEANAAAASVLNKPLKRLLGASFDGLFDEPDAEKVENQLMMLRSMGRAEDVALALSGKQQAILSSTIFRQESSTYYLMRLQPLSVGTSGIVMSKTQSSVVKIVEAMPEGFVVTDTDRRILTANAAFLDSAQLGSEEQARGEPIDRWLGRAGVDVSALFNALVEHGAVRQFQTVIRGQFGTSEDVEVSAVAAPEANPPCFGFSIRRVARRTTELDPHQRSLLRSVDEMTKLVGKVPLKDLVRETTDIIERLCIEAALKLNDNNRAGAADMLGLSRQSLYVKLHRYGIDEKSVAVDAVTSVNEN